jgi:hypothetical protein
LLDDKGCAKNKRSLLRRHHCPLSTTTNLISSFYVFFLYISLSSRSKIQIVPDAGNSFNWPRLGSAVGLETTPAKYVSSGKSNPRIELGCLQRGTLTGPQWVNARPFWTSFLRPSEWWVFSEAPVQAPTSAFPYQFSFSCGIF